MRRDAKSLKQGSRDITLESLQSSLSNNRVARKIRAKMKAMPAAPLEQLEGITW